jgi:hypothetical protein
MIKGSYMCIFMYIYIYLLRALDIVLSVLIMAPVSREH